MNRWNRPCWTFGLLLLLTGSLQAQQLTKSVLVEPGPVNSVLITRNDATMAVYGAKPVHSSRIQQLLLTHHRRDVVWHATSAIGLGAEGVGPKAEKALIEYPSEFWRLHQKNRFHDYSCQSTKVLSEPLPLRRWVEEGDKIEWQDLRFEVLDTPGYTRGSISYWLEVDGKSLAFTGDLIYGDGKLLDLYSFQDAIPEANIRGYHGYASRLSQLMASLRKLRGRRPDYLVPARGPIIHNPSDAIDKLIARVGSLYQNYLSTNALHWYFKEERMRTSGERVFGKELPVQLMPYANHEKTPDWIFEHATSRLIVSENGHGFLIDCGYQRVIDAIDKLISTNVISRVDGIFVTHYHDDHTDMVQAAAEKYGCPVYSTEEYRDILEHPEAYSMPAMTNNPIQKIVAMKSSQSLAWNEFTLQFEYFPGQAIYHGALLVKRKNEKPVFFIGDAFAPSGIDDYCLQNRNLLHDTGGFLLCLKKLRSIKEPFWLINEHISYVFEFSPTELDYLERRYRDRIAIQRELFPWDAPNYGVDERWSEFYPYSIETKPDSEWECQLRITNHSPAQREFDVKFNLPPGMRIVQQQERVSIAPGATDSLRLRLRSGDAKGIQLVTADIRSEGMEWKQWTEMLVNVVGKE